MTKGRKTTYEERIEIVSFCIEMIITVRWSRLSSKVRAIVPVLQSHFDFACLLWTY